SVPNYLNVCIGASRLPAVVPVRCSPPSLPPPSLPSLASLPSFCLGGPPPAGDLHRWGLQSEPARLGAAHVPHLSAEPGVEGGVQEGKEGDQARSLTSAERGLHSRAPA